jgi:anti-anti-sigma regulatory factor
MGAASSAQQEQCVSTTTDQSEETSTVRLEGEVDISGAQELKDRLMEALAAGREVRLELSAATALDITAFQLIWAVERAAKNAGVAFSMDGPVPEKIVLSMLDAGLEPFPGQLQ